MFFVLVTLYYYNFTNSIKLTNYTCVILFQLIPNIRDKYHQYHHLSQKKMSTVG